MSHVIFGILARALAKYSYLSRSHKLEHPIGSQPTFSQLSLYYRYIGGKAMCFIPL